MRFAYHASMPTLDQYIPLARAAEEMGFDSFTLPDSICYPKDSDAKYPYNDDGSRDFLDGVPFMVAGTFGFVLSFLTTIITAVSIVNERLTGTFEQLQVTPATALEIFLGKVLPLGAVFALDVVLMVLVGGVVFGVWPHGNPLFFVAVSSVAAYRQWPRGNAVVYAPSRRRARRSPVWPTLHSPAAVAHSPTAT